MRDQGHLFAGAPPYPFHAQVREATAPFFYEAIIGQLTPQEALDKMAAAAEDELHQARLSQVASSQPGRPSPPRSLLSGRLQRAVSGSETGPHATNAPATKMRSQLTGWLLLAPDAPHPLRLRRRALLLRPGRPASCIGTAFAADPTPRFAGVDNYRQLVFDDQFLYSVWLTLRFAFFAVAERDRARLPPRQAFPAGFPFQGLLPHNPHPAADGRTDRCRGDLAAADRARASGRFPTISTNGSASTSASAASLARRSRTTVVMDIWHWTPLVTLTLLAALRLDAEGAVRAGADRRRQPVPDLLAHHLADACGRRSWRPSSSG